MTAAFHTLGCKTNAYETQAVLEQFSQAGFEIGDFSGKCDVYVINTCAVTKEASRKSRQMIGRCRRLNPEALVVVTGCYAQEEAPDILKETGADIIVGNGEKSGIITLVKERLSGHGTEETVLVKDLSRCHEYEDQNISEQNGHVRAYVKIQDGCDRFCSYCLIPYLRGRSRSRSKDSILKEAEVLAASDIHEMVLTGIDISSFIIPEGRKEESLAELMEALDKTEGISRIRLGSMEAGIISEDLMERLKGIRAFCPQFHLSLQSGSDTVLRRMNRHYSTDEYRKAVELIRKYYPAAGITTDVITGFPGETEEEFEETCRFVKDIAFSRLHVFPYSRRQGTRADKMPGQLSKAVKEARAKHLIDIGEQLRRKYEERLIGTACSILVEETCILRNDEKPADADPEKIFIAGYTPEYVRILADAAGVPGSGPVYEKAAGLINKTVKVVPEVYKNGILMA